MNFTDTHCHLADPVLRENLPHILTAARKTGVGRFIVPATRLQDWQDVADLVQRSLKTRFWATSISHSASILGFQTTFPNRNSSVWNKH